jgi:transcriptional regulator with XRE-family HTH domain
MLEIISIMKEDSVPAESSDINTRIASRVRQARADAELSLDGLAQRCNVSRSMLSLVERGESSPTAVVLEKIAAGLGVTLASLFDDASATPSPLSRAEERAPWRDPQSGYWRTNISPPNFPSPIQIVEVVLPAGAHVAYDNGFRTADIHQQIWIQEGMLVLTIGGVVHRLRTGDCLAMRLDEPIAFRNRTRKLVRYIVVLASERPRRQA